eukprot:GHVP01065300.1.p1 GENE.GHVP01065300.1~~GHVP01065300.1.p1  ORF type:complete len:2045 (-),score=339.72 GHVP01065300.1:1330-6975(-)
MNAEIIGLKKYYSCKTEKNLYRFVDDVPRKEYPVGSSMQVKFECPEASKVQICIHFQGQVIEPIIEINAKKGLNKFFWNIDHIYALNTTYQEAYFCMRLVEDEATRKNKEEGDSDVATSYMFIITRFLTLSEFEFAYASFCRMRAVEMENVSETSLYRHGLVITNEFLKVCLNIRRPLPFEPSAEAVYTPGQFLCRASPYKATLIDTYDLLPQKTKERTLQAIFQPVQINFFQIEDFALDCNPHWWIESEDNYLIQHNLMYFSSKIIYTFRRSDVKFSPHILAMQSDKNPHDFFWKNFYWKHFLSYRILPLVSHGVVTFIQFAYFLLVPGEMICVAILYNYIYTSSKSLEHRETNPNYLSDLAFDPSISFFFSIPFPVPHFMILTFLIAGFLFAVILGSGFIRAKGGNFRLGIEALGALTQFLRYVLFFFFTSMFTFWFLLGTLINTDSFAPYAVMLGSLGFLVYVGWANYQANRKEVSRWIKEHVHYLLSLSLDFWYKEAYPATAISWNVVLPNQEQPKNSNFSYRKELYHALESHRAKRLNRYKDESRQLIEKTQSHVNNENVDNLNTRSEPSKLVTRKEFLQKIDIIVQKICLKNQLILVRGDFKYDKEKKKVRIPEEMTYEKIFYTKEKLPVKFRAQLATFWDIEKWLSNEDQVEIIFRENELVMFADGTFCKNKMEQFDLSNKEEKELKFKSALFSVPFFPPVDQISNSEKLQLLFSSFYEERKSSENMNWDCHECKRWLEKSALKLWAPQEHQNREFMTFQEFEKLYQIETDLEKEFNRAFFVKVSEQNLGFYGIAVEDEHSEVDSEEELGIETLFPPPPSEIFSIPIFEDNELLPGPRLTQSSEIEELSEEISVRQGIIVGNIQKSINRSKLKHIFDQMTSDMEPDDGEHLAANPDILAQKIISIRIDLLKKFFGEEAKRASLGVPPNMKEENPEFTAMLLIIRESLIKQLVECANRIGEYCFKKYRIEASSEAFIGNQFNQIIIRKVSLVSNSKTFIPIGKLHKRNRDFIKRNPPRTSFQLMEALRQFVSENDLLDSPSDSQQEVAKILQFLEHESILKSDDTFPGQVEFVKNEFKKYQEKKEYEETLSLSRNIIYFVEYLCSNFIWFEALLFVLRLLGVDPNDVSGNVFIEKNPEKYTDDKFVKNFSGILEFKSSKVEIQTLKGIFLRFYDMAGFIGFIETSRITALVHHTLKDHLPLAVFSQCFDTLELFGGSFSIDPNKILSLEFVSVGPARSLFLSPAIQRPSFEDIIDYTFLTPAAEKRTMFSTVANSNLIWLLLSKSDAHYNYFTDKDVKNSIQRFGILLSIIPKTRDLDWFMGSPKELEKLELLYPSEKKDVRKEDVREGQLRFMTFEIFHKTMVACGMSKAYKFSEFLWVCIALRPAPGKKDAKLWHFIRVKEGITCAVDAIMQPVMTEDGKIQRFKGSINCEMFYHIIKNISPDYPKRGIKALWKDIEKSPLDVTDAIPWSAVWMSSSASNQHPTRLVSPHLLLIGFRDGYLTDPTQGNFANISTVFVSVPRMLQTGLWSEAIRHLVIQELHVECMDNFILGALNHPYMHNRYHLLKAEYLRIVFAYFFNDGMSFSLMSSLFEKMRLNLPSRDIKRIFNLLDVNNDKVLEAAELLDGFEVLFEMFLPEYVMEEVGLSVGREMRTILVSTFFLLVFFAFLGLGFNSFADSSASSSAVRSVVALVGAAGLGSKARSVKGQMEQRIMSPLEDLFGYDLLARIEEKKEEFAKHKILVQERLERNSYGPLHVEYAIPKKYLSRKIGILKPCLALFYEEIVSIYPNISGDVPELSWTCNPAIPSYSGLTLNIKTGQIHGKVACKKFPYSIFRISCKARETNQKSYVFFALCVYEREQSKPTISIASDDLI